MSLSKLKRAALSTVRPVTSDRFIVGIRKTATIQPTRPLGDKSKRDRTKREKD